VLRLAASDGPASLLLLPIDRHNGATQAKTGYHTNGSGPKEHRPLECATKLIPPISWVPKLTISATQIPS